MNTRHFNRHFQWTAIARKLAKPDRQLQAKLHAVQTNYSLAQPYFA